MRAKFSPTPALVLILCATSFVVGCASVPVIETAVPKSVSQAPFPALLPLDHMLEPEQTRLTDTSAQELDARAEHLKRRAQTTQAAED